MTTKIKDLIKKIHHVGFIVKDLEPSIHFYELLGFKLTNRWVETEEECAYGLGIPGAEIELATFSGFNISLEIIQYLKSPGSGKQFLSNKIGAGHITLETDDIETAKTEMEKSGIKFASDITHHPTASWVHFLDPDGIRIELIEMK